jgi:hypothetical protein
VPLHNDILHALWRSVNRLVIDKSFGGWPVRYWVAYNDLTADERAKIARKCYLNKKPLPSRVQKSKRLCDGDVSRKAARKTAEKQMDEVNGYVQGDTIVPDLTIIEYWDKHYLPWATTKLKPSTLHGYKQAFGQHLKKHFGSTRPKDITTHQQLSSSVSLPMDGKAGAPFHTPSGSPQTSTNTVLQRYTTQRRADHREPEAR